MEITIIYGTETGNSESLAQDARAKLTKLGHQAKVVDMEGCLLYTSDAADE